MTTKDNFLKADTTTFTYLYEGKISGCRCGCRGNYIGGANMSPRPASFIYDESYLANKLKEAQLLVNSGAWFLAGKDYFEVQVDKDNCLCFYTTY